MNGPTGLPWNLHTWTGPTHNTPINELGDRRVLDTFHDRDIALLDDQFDHPRIDNQAVEVEDYGDVSDHTPHYTDYISKDTAVATASTLLAMGALGYQYYTAKPAPIVYQNMDRKVDEGGS